MVTYYIELACISNANLPVRLERSATWIQPILIEESIDRHPVPPSYVFAGVTFFHSVVTATIAGDISQSSWTTSMSAGIPVRTFPAASASIGTYMGNGGEVQFE